MTNIAALAFDIGGTEIRAAIANESGELLSVATAPTLARGGVEAVLGQIERLATEVVANAAGADIVGIGAAAPGPLDPLAGVVLDAPTLHGWRDVPLSELLAKCFNLPVRLENDANAAAIGEWRFGAAQGTSSMVFVTVSTGIGGGVIIDGRVCHGHRGLAAEVGHMTITDNSERCFCGGFGCFEAVASGTALAQRAASRAKQSPTLSKLAAQPAAITGRDVVDAARSGDEIARELLDEEARWLGVGFTNLIHLYSPEVVVMGGGISGAFDLMSERIRSTVRDRAMVAYRGVPIVVAQLGRHAGLVGAASLAFEAWRAQGVARSP